MHAANRLRDEIDFFGIPNTLPMVLFPDQETLPYDHFSPHQEIISDRIRALYQMRYHRRGILIVPVATALQKLADHTWLDQQVLLIKKGDRFDIQEMRLRFENVGYRCVSEVYEHGEFAVRGALIDLFPTGSPHPFRIDLFDDEVDSLRIFDPDTQRTTQTIEQIDLLPAREFPLHTDAINLFRRQFRTTFEGDPKRSLIYREISDKRIPNGIEYYLPLFFDSPLSTLFDYLHPDSQLLTFSENSDAITQACHEIAHRYEQLRHNIERPLLPPDALFLSAEAFEQRCAAFNSLCVISESDAHTATDSRSHSVIFETQAIPPLSDTLAAEPIPTQIQTRIDEAAGRVLICTASAGRRESLIHHLLALKKPHSRVDSWQAFVDSNDTLGVCIAPLETGVILATGSQTLTLLTETDLFGVKPHQARRRSRQAKEQEMAIRNLSDLEEGTAVVHIDHGVGRFIGLNTLTIDGVLNEFVTLEYAQGDKLYVPVSSLHLISRYSGSAADSPPLHRLGSGQWEKARAKAREKVRDTASELLEIYARREHQKGYANHYDELEYQRFASGFPFEETPDQQDAIESVIQDMKADQPMDRIVCGDVGFGKTEVAMRAAFIAVQNCKQVCVLVPTTLLAQQHGQNFRDRFADWPYRVEVLSRFETPKQQNEILTDIANGKVDVVIGTHRLLQKDVRFKQLGLLIIDEEHRFGVSQKEQMKALRSEVDILTLTATPIPRTLNLALANLRDLSIISTPPPKRLAVKTLVSEWNNELIREACLREIKRGGQIYFLHNEVKTIERVERDLTQLVPEAIIRHAHGQMREKELEQIMLDFYHQRFNLLVCSTIIESGIDVPTANTIIINRADKLGLAQLHQLRGRVGRSHHRAYAFLLRPPVKTLTSDAAKRLDAIEALEDLGAGFMLANHDMEIRGAGEFLGDEQTGHIQEIGYSLFMEMLEKAVAALKSGELPESCLDTFEHTDIDLHLPAILPGDYIPDVPTRLILYKRIANTLSIDDLDALQVEMIDRFGLLPEIAKTLFVLAELRIKAQQLGIRKLDIGPKGGQIRFLKKNQIDVGKVIDLIHYQPDRYRLMGEEGLKIILDMPEPETRMAAAADLLLKITPDKGKRKS
jgi:transcription-repair coupling factor (superfamily II helicase)